MKYKDKNRLLHAKGHHKIKSLLVVSDPGKEEPSVFIAVPNMGTIHTELMLQLVSWMVGKKVLIFPPQKFYPIAKARNVCVEAFLKSDYEWLFFVDSDTVPPADALDILLKDDKQFISGIVYTLKQCTDGISRPVPCVFRKPKNKREYKECGKTKAYYPIKKNYKGLKEIAAAGMACTLLHRSVFKNLKPPYFKERFVPKPGQIETGEDIMFCQEMERQGVKMWADFRVRCGHWKEIRIDSPFSLEVKPHESGERWNIKSKKFEK